MPEIRGLTVAVGEPYATTLAVCLPRNMRFMAECWVVTTPDDHAVKAVALSVPGVRVHETTDFYAGGSYFNKGLCIERCFDAMSRDGWLLVHDSDVIFPDALPLDNLNPEALHGIKRRILADPLAWHPDLDWSTCPVRKDPPGIGYFQLFHADAQRLSGKRPWYNVNYPHAGGGDAHFLDLWARSSGPIVTLPGEALHLGEPDRNWWGATTEGRDLMAAYVHKMGWRAAMLGLDPTAVKRVGDVVERLRRVDVPGYEMSDYLMWAERRMGAVRQWQRIQKPEP